MINSVGNSSFENTKLWKACSEFAGSMFYDVFKKMYESIPKSDLIPTSPAEKWYRSMLIYEYSKKAAEQDLKPLVNMVYKQIGGKVYHTR